MTRRRAADSSLLVSLGIGILLVPLGLLAVVLLVLAGEDASAPCLPVR